MATKKAVQVVEENLPMEAPSWLGDSVRGNEGVGHDDLTIPRISIIQDLSPQHKKTKPEYIEGAEAGMAFNTVTQELYADRVMIVPVLFRKEYVIWKNLDAGGGFRGAFPSINDAENALMELDDRSDCEIVPTNQHFCLVLDPTSTVADPVMSEAVISMSKSQNKVSKQLNSMIHAAGHDRFAHLFDLKVVTDQNAAGQEYYNWKPVRRGFATEEMYAAGEKLYNAVSTGEKDINRDPETPKQPEHKEGDVGENEEF
jgi:hypothetical protein